MAAECSLGRKPRDQVPSRCLSPRSGRQKNIRSNAATTLLLKTVASMAITMPNGPMRDRRDSETLLQMKVGGAVNNLRLTRYPSGVELRHV